MDEVLSVINQAIELEEDGRQYYLQAVARAQNPLAKNTFRAPYVPFTLRFAVAVVPRPCGKMFAFSTMRYDFVVGEPE